MLHSDKNNQGHQIILSLLRQKSGSVLAHACSMTQTSSRHRISSYLSIGLGLCQYKISTGKKVSPSGDRPIIFMYDASRQPQHQTDIVFIFDFQCSFASSQQKLLCCTACIPRQDLRFCNRSNPPMSDVFGGRTYCSPSFIRIPSPVFASLTAIHFSTFF